jgi:hypothetical protein
MVMIQSAPDPFEPIFRNFEKGTGWTLSPQARAILKEGLIAVDEDTLGLGDFALTADRAPLRERIVELMPAFLNYLWEKAQSRDKSEKKQQTIGGVFVLQNIGRWRVLFTCTCWPVI